MYSDESVYGYRIHDDYGSSYEILGDEASAVPSNELDLLRLVAKTASNDYIRELLYYVVENEKGMYIGSVYYEYHQIADALETGLNGEDAELPNEEVS
jgi:hypothetical protein